MKKISGKYLAVLCLFSFGIPGGYAQIEDSVMIKKIFQDALTHHDAYNNLRYLTKNIGHRLTGSEEAEKAVRYTYRLLEQANTDTVFLQPTLVRHWQRGSENEGYILFPNGKTEMLHICALGGSVGTDKKGISASVVEVDSLTDLKKMGRNEIEGKIVFFNRPMDPSYFRTFIAYGKAADQRTRGASEAARYGAVGVIVRSLTLANNQSPHTGILHYDTTAPSIPAVAVATHDADILHQRLTEDPLLKLSINISCSEGEKVPSSNVIGEIKGTVKEDEVIVISGHLDSWDFGEGAHDDGTGCMQSIETLRIFQSVGYQPRHTIRCILFMDEEIGQAGGRTYAAWSEEKSQKHLAAIEMDGGGTTPVGFSVTSDKDFFNTVLGWKNLFHPYGIWYFQEGSGGVDISFLKNLKVPLISLSTDSQRYFDYHHCELDTLEVVNEREMQLGSAAVASLIYLLDQQ